jgi:hypothetical protein
MKYLIAIAALIILAETVGVSQTNRLSRTKQRPHGVDSVSSWQLRPDSAALMKDSTGIRRRRRH